IGRWSRWDRRRVGPATWVPARSREGARWGTAYPAGGRGPPSLVGGPAETDAGWPLPRGFPPGPGRGSRLSLEKARTQRVAGGSPPPPFFMARSFPLARFCVVGRSGAMVRLFRSPPTCPDLDSHF